MAYLPTNPLGANSLVAVTSDDDALKFNLGFVPSASGTARIRGRADQGEVDLVVSSGIVYPIDIAGFDQTNSVPNTMTLILLRQIK